MSIRVGIAVLAAIFPFAAFAQITTVTSGQTSAEDCAAIGAILQDPSANHPQLTLSFMAAGSYGMDCDWKAIGVQAPRTTSENKGGIYSFVNPGNANDGKLREFELHYVFYGKDGTSYGTGKSTHCSARKQDGRWRFDACTRTAPHERL
jgi:hypothetical protein